MIAAREGESRRVQNTWPARNSTQCSTFVDLKAECAPTGFPATEQRIVFAGQELAEDECLSQAGVRDEATLQVLGRLLGGAKKRKKKTYTKPKKIKHKHKKIKLRILKFYKVQLACLYPLRSRSSHRHQH